MVIKYGNLGNILINLMYKDRFTTMRDGEETINPDGSSSKVLGSFLLDERCLVHKTTKDSSRDGNMDVARQEVVVTVFCSNAHDIKKGDILILSILDDNEQVKEKIQGCAGQPTYFPDHLEIEVYDWKVS